MKKINLKRQVAFTLSASMAFAMLAPAVPVNAAPDSRYKTIKFNLGIYNKYEGQTLGDLEPDTAVNGVIKAGHYAGYQVDTGANGQASTSVNTASLEMPWWNIEWDAFVNSLSTTNPIAKPNENTPGITWGGKTFNFKGYALAGWYENDFTTDPTQQRVNKLPTKFPVQTNGSTTKTYYAHYVSDGTTYNFKVSHKDTTTGAGILGVFDDSATTNVEDTKEDPVKTDKTLVSVQARPKVIPGLKANIPVVTIEGTQADSALLTKYNFTVDADNNVTGNIINKEVKVDYTYIVDTTKTFNFTSEHVYLNADGSAVTNRKLERASLNANADIASNAATVNVRQPDQAAITPQNGNTEARYKLVTTDGINPATGAAIASAEVKKPYYTAGTAADPNRFVVAHSNTFDSDHRVGGKMPNQSVGVRYTYMPNPNYQIHVAVKYVDENDQPIASLVKTAAGASWNINNDNTVEFNVVPHGTVNIPVPSLSSEGYGNPNYVYTSNALEVANTVNNYVANSAAGNYAVTIKNDTIAMKITYTKDPARWGRVTIAKEGVGSLKNADLTEYDNAQANPISLKKNISNEVAVSYAVLPTPEAIPGSGYDFDGYYISGTNIPINPVGDTNVAAPYKLDARFKPNSEWKSLTFKFGNTATPHGYMSPTGGKTLTIYPKDNAGNARVITLGQLSSGFTDAQTGTDYSLEFPQVVADAGYEVRWYDENGDRVLDTENMADRVDGAIFTAYCVSPFVARTPEAQGMINSNDGSVSINLLAASDGLTYNSDPSSYYAVTDESGKIVRLVRNRDLQAANGVIAGVLPGKKYQLHELQSNVGINGIVTEGSMITDIDPSIRSAVPKDVSTPVSVTPDVAVDVNNDRKNQVTISPVTPGMKYAILDANGNPVPGANWKAPAFGENSVTFGNLAPGMVYSVVVKPASDASLPSTDASLERLPFTASAAVNAGNKLSFAGIDVTELESMTNPPADYNDVPTGQAMGFTAPTLHDNKAFRRWLIISGAESAVVANGRRINVTMPAGNLILQPFYATPGEHADWGNNLVSPNVDNQSVNASIPSIPEVPGKKLRVHVEKRAVPTAMAAQIDALETGGHYKGLWMLKASLEEEVSAGNWIPFTIPAGSTYSTDIAVDTGRLSPNRTYSLYKATSSNATPEPINNVIDPNWQDANSGYPGYFTHNYEFGTSYILGYTLPALYRITIKENIGNQLLAQFDIPETDVLANHESKYASFIRQSEVDNNGITWTYKGLSLSDGDFDEFNPVAALDDDKTVYLYYANDRDERNAAEAKLNQLKSEAEALLKTSLKYVQRNNLNSALREALAVLNKVNPKATTAELLQAISRLETVLNDIKNGGSGGSSNDGSGGGGGGGGAASKGIIAEANANTSAIRVGQDGNWELVDAANHIWQFKLNDGSKLKGWAKLSYTYNGEEKIAWYHFNDGENMDSGWYYDASGNNWYYLSEDHNGFFGEMKTGWHFNNHDYKWYYLNPADGSMLIGWQNIGGNWYYLTVTANIQSWFFNSDTRRWEYRTDVKHPYGSLFINEATPDGYNVNSDGVWN